MPFEKRTARFHCTLAIAVPGKRTELVEGTCEGRIWEEKEARTALDTILFSCRKMELLHGRIVKDKKIKLVTEQMR